jgi:hypothetical protein
MLALRIMADVFSAAAPRAPAAPPPPQRGNDDQAGWGDLPPLDSVASAPAARPEPTPEESSRKLRASLFGLLSEDIGLAPKSAHHPWVLGRSTLELAAELRWRVFLLHVGGHAEIDPSYLVQEDVDGETRRTYAGWVLPWEAYLDVRGREVGVTVGRQIVAWGNAQLLPLLDLPNPRDQRVPGLGELGGQRIPVTMTRLTLDHEAHRFELMAIHEVEYRFRAPPMSFYSPLPQILAWGDGIRASRFLEMADLHEFAYRHEIDRWSAESQQLLARYRYIGSRIELGLHGGWLPHAEGALRLPGPGDLAADPVTFPVEHSRYTALGASLLGTRGDFVGFADTLVEVGRPVSIGDLDKLPPVVRVVRQSWARYVIGVRYAGIENGFVGVEHSFGVRVSDRGNDEAGLQPLLPVAPPAIAAIYQQRFAHERLEAEVTATALGPELRGGGAGRARLTFRPRDGLRFTLAYVLFLPGDAPSPIAGFTRHDRIDLGVRWDFATR